MTPLPFFRQALDSQLSGSVGYLETLQRLFRDDQISGLIEAQIDGQRQLAIVYAQGRQVGGYRIYPGQVLPYALGEPLSGWDLRGAPIRTVNLPLFAARAAWLALELYPPQPPETIEARQFPEQVLLWNADRLTGLVQIASTPLDGFFFLMDGSPIASEAAFSTPSGIINALPPARMIQERPHEILKYRIYSVSLSAASYKHLLLRLGLNQWLNSALLRYQEIVGQNLVGVMTKEVNTLLASRGWNLNLVGTSLVDQHLFMSLDNMGQAYRALLRATAEQIAKVIGGSLAIKIYKETYLALRNRERGAIEAQSLSPIIFS